MRGRPGTRSDWLFWLALPLSLGGCLRAAEVQTDIRQGRVLGAQVEGVPFVPQRPDTCGAAALASVLRHGGLAGDEAALAAALGTRPGQGALTYELVVEARRQGALAAQRYDITEETLRRAIDAGVAPIVLRGGLAHALLGVYHYSVLTAYDLDRRVWIGHDGEAADVVFSFADLEADRARADRWALFVVGPRARPLGLGPEIHIELGVQAEERGLIEAATHHHATAAWTPQSAQALLNLANVAREASDLPRAEGLLRAALLADPKSAAVRNNLAWVLYLQRRNLDEARTLATEAAQDPAVRPHAQDTLEHIKAAVAPGGDQPKTTSPSAPP